MFEESFESAIYFLFKIVLTVFMYGPSLLDKPITAEEEKE
jgi:hypothetical protein